MSSHLIRPTQLPADPSANENSPHDTAKQQEASSAGLSDPASPHIQHGFSPDNMISETPGPMPLPTASAALTFSTSPTSLPQGIIFDWEGTLVDSRQDMVMTLNRVLTAFSAPAFTLQEQAQLSLANAAAWMRQRIAPRHHAAAEALFKKQMTAFCVRPVAYAGIFLQWLTRIGVPLGVVSNKQAPLLRQDVKRLGWAEYFHVVVGAGEGHAPKPSPEPLTFAMTQMGLAISPDVLFVGDTTVDVTCGQAAGCTTVHIGLRETGDSACTWRQRLALQGSTVWPLPTLWVLYRILQHSYSTTRN